MWLLYKDVDRSHLQLLSEGRKEVFANLLLLFQMFDVETSDLLLEIRPSFLSTVLHCDVCPTSNLLAMALSNYAVEVKHTHYIQKEILP